MGSDESVWCGGVCLDGLAECFDVYIHTYIDAYAHLTCCKKRNMMNWNEMNCISQSILSKFYHANMILTINPATKPLSPKT